MLVPSLAVGAKLADELLGAGDDGLATRLEELAGVVALAHAGPRRPRRTSRVAAAKASWQAGVDVDLGDAQGDGLLDHARRGCRCRREGRGAGRRSGP